MQIPVRKGPMMLIDRRLLDPPAVEGVAVHAWTIDDRPEMERLLDLGVDGIISNRPTLLKQVFSERGLWGRSLSRPPEGAPRVSSIGRAWGRG